MIFPVGGAPGPQATLSFSSSSLHNGDQVVATVYTYDYGPPEPVAFTSDTIGNIVCNN